MAFMNDDPYLSSQAQALALQWAERVTGPTFKIEANDTKF